MHSNFWPLTDNGTVGNFAKCCALGPNGRQFLRATAECFAFLSHRLGVRPSARLSVTLVICIKTVQARITKFSLLAARKTLVSGTVQLVHKFEEVTLNEGAK